MLRVYSNAIKRELMNMILASGVSNAETESSKGFDPVRDALLDQ